MGMFYAYFMPSLSPLSSKIIDSLTRRSLVTCRLAVAIQPMNCFRYDGAN